VPSAVTITQGAVNCNNGYACAHLNAGSSFSTTGPGVYNLTGTGYMCWPSCTMFVPEWTINYGTFCGLTGHCCYVMNFNLSPSVSGGRWSDGTTTWYPTIHGGFSGQCLYGNGAGTGCVRATAGTNGGGASKSWQNFAAPQVCHAFWS